MVRALGRACALLLVLLVGCAPAVAPARTTTIDGSPIVVAPGEIVRGVETVGFGAFDLRPGDLAPLPLPELLVEPREDVTTAFVLRPGVAPEGWNVRLDRVVRVVEPLVGAGRSYALEVAVRVEVPVTAEPGTYRVAALVYALGAGQRWVEMLVRVAQPS